MVNGQILYLFIFTSSPKPPNVATSNLSGAYVTCCKGTGHHFVVKKGEKSKCTKAGIYDGDIDCSLVSVYYPI